MSKWSSWFAPSLATAESVVAGHRTTEVARVWITDAGRKALAAEAKQ
jgi:hypothetical protein